MIRLISFQSTSNISVETQRRGLKLRLVSDVTLIARVTLEDVAEGLAMQVKMVRRR